MQEYESEDIPLDDIEKQFPLRLIEIRIAH